MRRAPNAGQYCCLLGFSALVLPRAANLLSAQVPDQVVRRSGADEGTCPLVRPTLRGTGPEPRQPCQNTVVLTDEFFQEIPIPTDLRATRALPGSPAALDLFAWLSYRCYVANGEERIPLFGEFGLAHQLGGVEYTRPRRFREGVLRWLEMITAIWPECPARISPDGQALLLAKADAIRATKKPRQAAIAR